MPGLSAGPALIVCLTALFALPPMAGGYRLVKWGVFGLALFALAFVLLLRPRAARAALCGLPRRAWWPPVAFVAAAVLLPAFSPSLAAAHWPLALVLLTGLAFLFVTAIALNHEEDAARTHRTNLVLLTSTGALCATLVLLQAAGLRWMTEGVPPGLEFRAPGTFGNPNWAAAFLATLAPLSLALAATARGEQQRRQHHGVAALLALGVVATLSKDGVLTLVAGVLIYLLMDGGMPARRRLALLGAALSGAASLLVLAWQMDWLRTAPWLRGRWFVWQAALLLSGEHPLTGLGMGGFLPAYGQTAEHLRSANPALFMPLSVVDVAHNELLQFAAEGGFVTVAAFVTTVISAVTLAWRDGTPLGRGVGAAVAALFVNGLADPPLRMPVTFALFFFLLGWLAAAASHREKQEADRTPSTRRAWLTSVLLAAAVLLGAVQGLRYTAGNLYWTWGRDALDERRSAFMTIPHYEKARFFMPEHGRMAAEHARALSRAGRLKDALEASHAASALRFDWDDEIFRADLQARLLERDAVIRMWRDLAARHPMLLTPYLRLGALHLQAGDPEAAIAEYEAVLARPQPTRRGEEAHTQAGNMLRLLRRKQPTGADPSERKP